MALNATVGATDANSYVTLAEFKAYADTMGWDLTAHDDAAIESACIRGTSYLDGTYGARWIGVAATQDQALEWPRKDAHYRNGILPDDAIPQKVKDATCLAAWQETQTPNSLSGSFAGKGAQVVREKVGELEVQYSDQGALTVDDMIPTFTTIEGVLFGLISIAQSGGLSWSPVIRG